LQVYSVFKFLLGETELLVAST